jgi:galactokinase/mevalonate kinase-like predicted kinase
MIIPRTPLRISIGGGGTDLPSYYREFGGFVISAGSINMPTSRLIAVSSTVIF